MMSLVSCDKIKEATSLDFNVNNVSFDFSTTVADNPSPMPAESASLRATTATQTFSVTRTINISELGSDDAVKYANKISNVAVSNSLITIEASPAGSYTVENIKITADGVTGSPLNVPTFTIDGSFTFTTEMNKFTAAFIAKLLSAKSISVTVSGTTNAPVGTTIDIYYKSNLVLTASLL